MMTLAAGNRPVRSQDGVLTGGVEEASRAPAQSQLGSSFLVDLFSSLCAVWEHSAAS